MENPTKPSHRLPEDDGMGTLRKRLLALQAEDLPCDDKARCMHEIMLEGYHLSQQMTPNPQPTSPTITASSNSPSSPPASAKAWKQTIPVSTLESLKFWQHPPGETPPAEQFVLTAEDVQPTFATVKSPKDTTPEAEQERPLGCRHYRRNVKLQCSTCGKWYTCRFCHDAAEDHSLIRKDTKNMLCMLCAYPQKAGDTCVNCGVGTARYYCNVCKLWDDHPDKKIYHCNDCGICRRGMGLGKDFFHCKKCCACISISIQVSHKCIERSTDCDCPICGEYLFTSPNPVVFMVCGHSIHSKCYNEHMKRSYKCPICNKSLLNMESYFRRLDLDIQSQPMPPEFRSTSATILCNDCSGKSTVPYHWLGLKCALCRSYNTAEIRIDSNSNTDTGTGSGSSVERSAVSPDQASSASQGAQGPVQSQAAAEVTVSVPIETTGQSARRRHSSHANPGIGVSGVRAVVPDRLARSASPPLAPGMGMRASATTYNILAEDSEDDTDEDMLGLWVHRLHESSSDEVESLSEESEIEEEDEDEEEDDDDEDDDDDDDNEIVLIGHR
ncbi:zf-CHY-domain-containing protein [Sodiomyces alkalinus F11]|uniref:Zf-CHY-domain-containing protein n=1 Tax=Sodiomyces alkalinus (strain CBS 110278 / VKM F-3762 / F11) TaxID=1314773 RepID=A0A3N2PXX6_SODAK|nr:zf-CHY-domain-containing protein [Sodiomyces alkalinus F11]ROT39393.1 zf-CHY-domain-containing protein [Sodiomyces alkalinus F11]